MQSTTSISTGIITAEPSAWAKAFWGRWFTCSLRRHFHEGWIAGEGALARLAGQAGVTGRTSAPIILCCSHGSWWDAAITIVLSLRIFRLNAIGMMEHRQLRKYRFFRRIGMFSVVREDPRSALASLQYAAERLRNDATALWMFPQGELVQQDVRPIVAGPGVGILLRSLGQAWIVPVAIRYELLREQRPEFWVRVGEPQYVSWDDMPDIAAIAASVARMIEHEADIARHDAVAKNVIGYRRLVQGRRSIEKLIDSITGVE